MQFLIAEATYTLTAMPDGEQPESVQLPGGAGALLAVSRPVDEAALEAAIERAEDWLMPHAARMRGEVLEVADVTGRLQSGLQDVLSVTTHQWSLEDVESFFLRLVEMTTGRHVAPALQGRQRFIADIVILRELAHHGQVREIKLRTKET
jgi:hypothetical protein